MKIRNAAIGGVCFALVLGLSATAMAGQAKDQKSTKMEKATKMDKAAGKTTNLQGTVQSVDQSKSTIVVVVGKAARPFAFGSGTKFLYGHSDNNKPGMASQLKKGNFIACSGTLDTKGDFMAKECVYRETK